MKYINITSIVVILAAFVTGACSPAGTQTATSAVVTKEGDAEIANPASQHCIDQGGTMVIQQRGDGGEYGVCIFEENRQCEELAMLRGDCPVGGLKIIGYLTPAAQYCAITGGEYAITASSGQADEGGTCTFKNGKICDVWEYFKGECDPGNQEEAVTSPPADMSPTKEVEQIVFSSDRGGDYDDLYLIDLDGANMVRLTEGESNSFAGPFSPDGQQIVYTYFGLTTSDIYVMNADGSNQTNLTDLPDFDEGFPDWSPDGNQIAFTSRRDGNNEVYVMQADGSNPIRLTDNPNDDFAPSWSPDGSQIAFISDRDQETGIYDIYIMTADGSQVSRLTNDTAIDYSPDWSPDGTQIIFRSHHNGPADIYVINVDGSGLENLTNSPKDEWAPTWSPDGSQIAFQSNRDGNWEIYVMYADGSDQTNLTNDPADDQLPFWRPQ